MGTETELQAEVTFVLRDEKIEALKAKAAEIDDDYPPEGGYNVTQALQVVWHREPEWLHDNHVLSGWTLDKSNEGGTMRDVW